MPTVKLESCLRMSHWTRKSHLSGNFGRDKIRKFTERFWSMQNSYVHLNIINVDEQTYDHPSIKVSTFPQHSMWWYAISHSLMLSLATVDVEMEYSVWRKGIDGCEVYYNHHYSWLFMQHFVTFDWRQKFTYCHVPKTMSPISYAFNITWLNVISEGLHKLITFMSAFQYVPSNP